MFMKQIPVEALAVGMYVVALDRPWSELAGLGNKQRIECPEDIALLKQYGVQRVTIDPALSTHAAGSIRAESVALAAALPASPQRGKPALSIGALERELARAHTVRTEAMTAVQSFFEGVKTGIPISNAAVREAVHTLTAQILQGHDALLSVIHIRHYDTNLFAHAVDVCVFALVVGKHQGFEPAWLEQLGTGALLHDVGYLRLPRNLLRKPSIYTAQERRLMQQHPRLGAMIMAQSGKMHHESLRIVEEHHERLDGSGYPAGLRSLAISPLSEIVGIVDTYDAMLSSREGRPPLPPAQAIKELYKYGLQGQFNRGLVERVIQCLGVYPVGSLVELNTGERGLVTAVQLTDTLRPTVKIIWDASQHAYPMPFIVDLGTASGQEHERCILRALDPQKERVDIAAYMEGSH
jgi:HD-GYP domain-containing protein (c-di-GMP phosphodiesterase class II)